MQIINKQEDGRYYAEYKNPSDRFCNEIGQYGSSALGAEVNLRALLIAIKNQMVSIHPSLKMRKDLK
jgi:hypothetical protein